MSVNFRNEAPEIIKEYLFYCLTIRGKSEKTVNEYYLDLRMFFRYMKLSKKLVKNDTPLSEINIDDIDLDFIKSIRLTDGIQFMDYLFTVRNNKSAARARKCSALKGYFKYLHKKKNYISADPFDQLELPKTKKSLPKYLTLEQSVELLNAVDGNYKERDYCIITLFLNCGLRVSEMSGLNYTDIRTDNTMRVLGKGNKERIIYLNSACISAINEYMKTRPVDGIKSDDKKALFISRNKRRMSTKTIQAMVYKYIKKIGLSSQGYSCHKLRHTAATLMYQHGGVDIRVLKDVLGHENLGTTEIYTHLNSEQMKNAAASNPLANIKEKSKKSKSEE